MRWLLALLLLIPLDCFAFGVGTVGTLSQGGPVVGTPPAEAYEFYWSGDASNDADYNSGVSLAATAVGSFTRSAAAAFIGANGGDMVSDIAANGLTFALPGGFDTDMGTYTFKWNPQTLTNLKYLGILTQGSAGAPALHFRYDTGYVYINAYTNVTNRSAYYLLNPTINTWYTITLRWLMNDADGYISIQVDNNQPAVTNLSSETFLPTISRVAVGSSYYNSMDTFVDEVYLYQSDTEVLP